MNELEMRLLDISIAIAFEFTVLNGTMFSPSGTLMGGSSDVYILGHTETDDHIIDAWWSYTPRYTKNMRDAMWLLIDSFDKFHLHYNLYNEEDMHTCEFGFWVNEAGHPNQIWSSTECAPSLAIAKAVAQCPVTMGIWCVSFDTDSWGKFEFDPYRNAELDDVAKTKVLALAIAARKFQHK